MNFKTLKDDLLAGLVVFFVAVPLCLGIAVASGVPPISGLISGIFGGLVIGFLSKSQVSVSGPAAGLVAIVLTGLDETGSLAAFALAVLLAGLFQIAFGLLKAGVIAYYFPTNVIKGMLSAIGIIIIMKQIPHFMGIDQDYIGDLSFFQPDGKNTFTELFTALSNFVPGVLIVGIVSILAIILWDKFKFGKLKVIPGALLGVIVGVIFNQIFRLTGSDLTILGGKDGHLVNIPTDGISNINNLIVLPAFDQIGNSAVWITAITIAIVASIETLLTIEATDKIDPQKRVTPTNRELWAQGIGNTLSGLIGGLPITSVIIRSSANINSGGKTKTASIFHGLLLLLGTLFFAALLNEIPLASLAAILLVTGWKLANPKIFKEYLKKSPYQYIPYLVTVVAIVFTDLLVGIGIGMVVSIVGILIKNIQKSHYYSSEKVNDRDFVKIQLPEEVSFLNKASLRVTLDRIKEGSQVLIDASKSFYIDHDVLETIREFANEKAVDKNIEVKMTGFKEEYGIVDNYHLDLETT